jgi:hypothetical protein
MENPHFSSPQIDGRQHFAQRAADSMLRTLGPTQVSLRIAEPGTGDIYNQLGIASPTVEDVPLSPAVVRTVSAPHEPKVRYEVLLSACSLQQAINMYQVTDVATWLLTAVGLVYGDAFLHVDTVTVDHYAGAEYLYRLVVSE